MNNVLDQHKFIGGSFGFGIICPDENHKKEIEIFKLNSILGSVEE